MAGNRNLAVFHQNEAIADDQIDLRQIIEVLIRIGRLRRSHPPACQGSSVPSLSCMSRISALVRVAMTSVSESVNPASTRNSSSL